MGIRFSIDYENSLCHFLWWSKPKPLMNLFIELSMFKLDFGCVWLRAWGLDTIPVGFGSIFSV